MEPRDLLLRQIVAAVDSRDGGMKKTSSGVGVSRQLAPSCDARRHGELVGVEMERREMTRGAVVVAQLELDLADQCDVVGIPRFDRVGVLCYLERTDEVVPSEERRREQREGLPIVRRPKAQRAPRHLFGARVVGEAARRSRPLQIKTRELRSVTGALRVLGGAALVEGDIEVANLAFRHRWNG